MNVNSIAFNEDTSIWNERLKEELEKIKSQNQSRDKNEIVRVWGQNRNLRYVSHEDLLAEDNIAKIKKIWVEVPESESQGEDEEVDSSLRSHSKPSEKKCKVVDGKTGNIQEVCMKVMTMVTPPPTMTTWIPILRNKRFSNTEKQFNIPYFSDEVHNFYRIYK